MTESNVLYTQAANPNAGAVPQLTNVATHDRFSDGAEVQDVYIDNIPPIAYDAGGRQRVSQHIARYHLWKYNALTS